MKAGMINGILNNENNSVSSRIFFRNWMINNIRKNLLDAIEISDYDEVKINLERLEKKKKDRYINQEHLDKIINNNDDDFNLLINNFIYSWVSDDENLEITKLLVKHGANINLICDNISILGHAIIHSIDGKYKNIDFLIKNGSDTKWIGKDGMTHGFIACNNKNLDNPVIINRILNKDIINIIYGKKNNNLLLSAIQSKNYIFVEQILNNYSDIIDINYLNIDNNAAIHLIVMTEKIDLLEKILSVDNLNIDIQTSDRENALFISIRHLRYTTPEIISKLINVGSNINIKNNKGTTPIMYTIKMLNLYLSNNEMIDKIIDIINQLINAGSNIKLKDNYGNNVRFYINNIRNENLKKIVNDIIYKPTFVRNPTGIIRLGVINK